jgi:hypothetical protein
MFSGHPREIVIHVLRTIALCLGGAALLYAAIYGMIYLRFSPYLLFGVLFGGIGAWIYFSARWHPYWAPIAKDVLRKPWVRDDGVKMVTVVEVAIIQASYVRLEVYRVSIYEQQGMRRVKRRLVGDDATFLGLIHDGLWFYIDDRFYGRKDGLVCVDMRTGDWVYHQPKSKVQLVEAIPGKTGTIDVVWEGERKRVELKEIEVEREV